MNHWRRPQPIQPVKTLPSDYLIVIGTTLIIALGMIYLFLWTIGVVEAAECPTPGEPCKVITLSPQEEQFLTTKNGILDTAQAARYLDLGNVVAYFRDKIAKAPAGEVKPKDLSTDKPSVVEPSK